LDKLVKLFDSHLTIIESKQQEDKSPPHPPSQPKRNKSSNDIKMVLGLSPRGGGGNMKVEEEKIQINVGDVVKAKILGNLMAEGVVVDVTDNETKADVDFGDEVETISAKDVFVVSGWGELEKGDRVEVKIDGSFLKYPGTILGVTISQEGVIGYSVKSVDGDVEDDIPKEWIIKVGTGRELALKKVKKTFNTIKVRI